MENCKVYLQDKSSTGRVRPWRQHKVNSLKVSDSMRRIWQKHPRRNIAFKGRAERMENCSNYLAFGQHLNLETGEVTRRLDAANFCRDRLCPMCSWRKSLVMFGQVSRLMDAIDAEAPGEYVPLFLTLTMKNVPDEGLADAIDQTFKGWSRMTNKATNPRWQQVFGGFMRVLEITYNSKDRTWHVHIHAIVLAPTWYFDDPAAYMDNHAWQALWRKALRVDYDPIVDIRTIKGERAKAVAEVAKYTVKPGEWLSSDDDATDARVELLATVLKNRRLVAYGGLMQELRKALKMEDAEKADLVNTESADGEEIRGDVLIALERYSWQVGVTNYVLTRTDTFVEVDLGNL